jgi:diaminohydroxyphosphoribosylaminopyrimidine deaminase/5-amino-6-(5-phosphoribosylamino)uracil reductase
LTDRSGLKRRRPLVRVVLGDATRLSPKSQLNRTASEAPVIVLSNTDLRAVLKELAGQSLQSVLVEGGATVAGAFLDAGLVNKVTFFIAPKIIGATAAPSAIGGTGVEKMSDALELENISVIQRGRDIEVTGYPRHEG